MGHPIISAEFGLRQNQIYVSWVAIPDDAPHIFMNFAYFFHWKLPMLVNGAYVTPLLVGHSRWLLTMIMYTLRTHLSRAVLWYSPAAKEKRSMFSHMSCPGCPMTFLLRCLWWTFVSYFIRSKGWGSISWRKSAKMPIINTTVLRARNGYCFPHDIN